VAGLLPAIRWRLLTDPGLLRHLRRTRLLAVCCLIISAGAHGGQGGPEQVTVGALEEVPGAYVNEPSHYAVRAMFRLTAGRWQTLPNYCDSQACLASITSSYPARVNWTISSQGRSLGTLWAHTPGTFAYYADIGQQEVEEPDRVPTLGAPSVDYSGFQARPLHRPLLATAGAIHLTKAPADWQPRAPNLAELSRVWPAFRRLTPLVDDCRIDAKGEYIPSKGRPPHQDELEIAGAWANKGGDAILQVRVRPAAFANCDGPSEHPSEYWFYQDAKGGLRPLPGQGTDASTERAEIDSRARLVMPLDFVDLQGDGRDVSIFLLAGYDAGGYALYFDNFRQVVRFTWLYH
jgi:hypothetical protein